MKYRRYAALTLITLSAVCSGSAVGASLELVVHKVQSTKGKVIAALCDKETFLKKCEYQEAVPAANGKVVLKFENVPAGRYAISAYHDENNNQTLDRNAFGIPAEGYGFSRDARGNFGPPKFEEAAFNINEGANAHELSLSYI